MIPAHSGALHQSRDEGPVAAGPSAAGPNDFQWRRLRFSSAEVAVMRSPGSHIRPGSPIGHPSRPPATTSCHFDVVVTTSKWHGCGSFGVSVTVAVLGGARDRAVRLVQARRPRRGPGRAAEGGGCAPAYALWWPVCHAPPEPPACRGLIRDGAGDGSGAADRSGAPGRLRPLRTPRSPQAQPVSAVWALTPEEPHPSGIDVVTGNVPDGGWRHQGHRVHQRYRPAPRCVPGKTRRRSPPPLKILRPGSRARARPGAARRGPAGARPG